MTRDPALLDAYRSGQVQVRQAVEATEGELLWFAGSTAATFYGKDCGGLIEAASQVWPDLKAPYLKGHDDPYCRRPGWTSTRCPAVSSAPTAVPGR